MFKRISIFLFFGLFLMSTSVEAQSFIFGPKFGPSFALQTWNDVNRDVLLTRHFAFFIESYDERNPNSSLFAQIGYHQRGSSQQTTIITGIGNPISRGRRRFEFNNISLLLGAKQMLKEEGAKPFYTVGIRGEYTINTNLNDFNNFGGYFPIDFYVNKINYGFTVSGGFQKEISDFVGAQIELSIHPDVSKQYFSPPLVVSDPFNAGASRQLREQNIRNITLELSVALRFLRKVEYID